MTGRRLIASGSPFEPIVGLSRAVRIGDLVCVAGTAPIAPDGTTAGPGDVYGQTRRCLEICGQALTDAGLSFGDVIRTRILLTEIASWREAARAHGEIFSAIRPANTIMAVTAFIDPAWLVEIEMDAVSSGASG